jgi:uncharacterized protein YceK
VAQNDPRVQPIYGGVRTDINCIIGIKSDSGSPALSQGLAEGIAKPFSVIDLPLSFAADTLTLPLAILWTLQHRPLPTKEGSEAGMTRPNDPLPPTVKENVEGLPSAGK